MRCVCHRAEDLRPLPVVARSLAGVDGALVAPRAVVGAARLELVLELLDLDGLVEFLLRPV